jgi:NADH-ubiquinone oxidoreductase chain 6
MNSFLLDALAFGAMLSAILVITAKNPVISVLFLISVFLNVAAYLVLLGVAYLGLVYIIVYVGAIAILFLFVVMMLNLRLVELLDTGSAYTQNLPFGTLLGSLFFFEVLSITPASYKDSVHSIFQMNSSMYTKINELLYPTISGQNLAVVAYNPLAADLSFTKFLQIESIGQGLYTYGSL